MCLHAAHLLARAHVHAERRCSSCRGTSRWRRVRLTSRRCASSKRTTSCTAPTPSCEQALRLEPSTRVRTLSAGRMCVWQTPFSPPLHLLRTSRGPLSPDLRSRLGTVRVMHMRQSGSLLAELVHRTEGQLSASTSLGPSSASVGVGSSHRSSLGVSPTGLPIHDTSPPGALRHGFSPIGFGGCGPLLGSRTSPGMEFELLPAFPPIPGRVPVPVPMPGLGPSHA